MSSAPANGNGDAERTLAPPRDEATNDSCYLGVDLGGTQLRMGAAGPDGRLLADILSLPTGRGFGPADLVAQLDLLQARIAPALGGRKVASLGIGAPGVIRPGPLTQCDNLPLLNGTDLVELVGSARGRNVSIENDARCFVLAEARFGAARGAGDVVGLALGTGVGCGVMVARNLHRGHHREAGEAWRLPLRGEPIESHVSGTGIVRAYHAAGGRPEIRDAAAVAGAAREGDEAARAAWRSFGRDLGFLCQCVASLLDPECLVLGGSLALARDLFDEMLRESLSQWPTRVVYSTLGTSAGVIGAAALQMP
jgi:glucokinase